MKANQAYLLIGAIALAILTVTSCSAPAEAQEINSGGASSLVEERTPGAGRVVPVRTATATRSEFVEYGEYVGEARGIAEVRLTAGAPGRVERVTVENGDPVSVGTSLAEISPERARTMHETARLNERLARETWEREVRFLDQGNSFQLKVDQAHLAWLQARTDLLDATRVLESQFAVSPIDGIVVQRHIAANDELDPGDPTFDVADLSRMRITIGVPESDMAGVRSLDGADVSFAALPGRTFTGRASNFARIRSERTLTYSVEIEIDNPDGEILSGQTARVRLPLRRHPEAVVVPSSAIFVRSDATYMMVVENGVAREVRVESGASSPTETVILSGLHEGSLFVTEGFNRLADGAAVEIVG
jgi:membrane fusion protein, multidrug efflux system